MKKTALYISAVIMAMASAFSSCTDNKPELWEPETASLCGEWICEMYQEDELIDIEIPVLTYNTADNDSHIWVEEQGGYFEEVFESSLIKCEGNPKELTFAGGVISEGKIFLNAVEVWPPVLEAGPITVDSIAFKVDFGDGDIIQYQGHRFTGWEDVD